MPDSGFVFCCFNASYKILPPVFDIWMRLLRQVPESVLWLLQTDPAVAMAHAAALRALQALPAEATNQSERLHARHQWNERRRFLRMGQRGRGTS